MKKVKQNYNRVSYNNGTRITRAHIARKVAYIDTYLDVNIIFNKDKPSEAGFNSLVAQVVKDSHYKKLPIRFAAAYVVRLYNQQFKLDLSDRYDQLHRSLSSRFDKKANL
jgi:hypothetical protein